MSRETLWLCDPGRIGTWLSCARGGGGEGGGGEREKEGEKGRGREKERSISIEINNTYRTCNSNATILDPNHTHLPHPLTHVGRVPGVLYLSTNGDLPLDLTDASPCRLLLITVVGVVTRGEVLLRGVVSFFIRCRANGLRTSGV